MTTLENHDTLPLPPEVAAANLKKLEWIAVPYDKPDRPDKQNGGVMQGPLVGVKDGKDSYSFGFGYYVMAHIPAAKYKTKNPFITGDEATADAMINSLSSLEIPRLTPGALAGVGGDRARDGDKFVNAVGKPGFFYDSGAATIVVHGEELIKTLGQYGIPVPLPKHVQKEIDKDRKSVERFLEATAER